MRATGGRGSRRPQFKEAYVITKPRTLLAAAALIAATSSTAHASPPLAADAGWRELCAILAVMAGSFGPITIAVDGDVIIADEQQLDCPPYEDPPVW